MPVDTSIYFQQRPFTMADPLDQSIKRFQLEDMQRRSVASDRAAKLKEGLQLSEAVGSDAITLDTLYRQALQANGGDRNKAIAHISPIYGQVRAKWASLGHQIDEQFDPDKNFAAIGSARENIQYLKTLQPDVKMQDTGGAITPTNVNPAAGPVGPLAGTEPLAKTPTPTQPTEFARLTAERDALPIGDSRRAEYDRIIKSYKAGRATDVTINQPGPMPLTKPGANKVDEGLLDTTRNLMQLDQIAGQFKPEYQTLLTKVSNKWSAVKETLGADLTNKEKKDLEEFSSYKRNAIDSLNQYIKSITGAAMTNAEAERILKGLPNPGSGLFDGDSPTEFKAKMDDAIRVSKIAIARLAYLKRKGLSLEDGAGNASVQLEQMPQLMNQRGAEIEKQLKDKQPNADSKALQRAVRRQLAVEFGLVAD